MKTGFFLSYNRKLSAQSCEDFFRPHKIELEVQNDSRNE